MNPETETLRDKFAMAALQGCLAYSHYNEQWGDYHNNGTNESVASYVYKIADAMIIARAAPPKMATSDATDTPTVST